MTEHSRLSREIVRYTKQLRQEGLTEKYVLEQTRILRHFQEFCAERAIRAPSLITSELAKEFLLRLDGMSVTYQKMTTTTLRGFLRFAEHPAAHNLKVKMSGTSRTRIRWLTEEQVGKIFAARGRPVTEVMICFGLLMGLRMCEMLRVKWNEANDALSTGNLQVHGKGHRPRPVPLHPDAREALVRYMVSNPKRKDPELLLGFQKSRAEDLLNEFIEDNGLEHFAFHDMRRTCATMWAEMKDEQGIRIAEIESISEVLGHQDIRTTKKYISVNLRTMVKAMSCYRIARHRTPPVPSR